MLTSEPRITCMSTEMHFGEWLDRIAGRHVTADNLVTAGFTRATAGRKIKDSKGVTAEDVIRAAKYLSHPPLVALIEFYNLMPDVARPELTAFTDIELCEEILRRARSRALDSPLSESVTVQEAESPSRSDNLSDKPVIPLRANRRRLVRTRNEMELVLRLADAKGDDASTQGDQTGGPQPSAAT